MPIAIIERPKKDSEILRIFEISIAELTVICAPSSVIIIERSMIGIPNFNGFLIISLEAYHYQSQYF